jgi:hypothetical protein
MRHNRERIIERVKHRLIRKGRPRLLVTLILLLTGLAGFLVSFSLLRFGMTRMWLRYPLAILTAYCVFLLLLRLWLFLQRNSIFELADSDLLDIEVNSTETSNYAEGDFHFSGGGGDASGAGGAGGSQDFSLTSHSASSASASDVEGASSSAGGGGGGGGLGDLDLDEGWAVVVVIVAVVGALLAIFYVIYVAPVLLAEILVDGILVTGLYKKMKGIEQRHWLSTAVRKTLAPALIAATLFSLAGWALQRAAPKAQTIGEAWREMMED